MFSSISRLFLRWRGQKSIAKLDGAMAGFSLWIRHCMWYRCILWFPRFLYWFPVIRSV